MLANTDYVEELVKNKLISESAAPKKVWMEHPRLQKYSLASFWSVLNKSKNKDQFHMWPPTKNNFQKSMSRWLRKVLWQTHSLALYLVWQRQIHRMKAKVSCLVLLQFIWLLYVNANNCSQAGGLNFSDKFNDNDNDDLLSGSGLKKRVSGMIIEADAEYKKKKSNGYEEKIIRSKIGCHLMFCWISQIIRSRSTWLWWLFYLEESCITTKEIWTLKWEVCRTNCR